MSDTLQKITEVVGTAGLVTGTAVSERATSYWDASPCQAMAIVEPATTAELAAVLKICHEHGQPVVVQGGLTGCVSGAVASTDEIIVSTRRMNAIEQLDSLGHTATVQAGVVLQDLQDAAASNDLLFPLDLGARGSCTVGGNIATNAGGNAVLRYGMIRQLVLGLEVVTAEGEVISSMNQMLKNNAGYDLKQLYIGSEGTLGIVTRAVVRLFPAPTTRNTALLACDSFGAVARVLGGIKAAIGETLSAFEVMWGGYYAAVTDAHERAAPLAAQYPYYIIVEAEGSSPEEDTSAFERVLESLMTDGAIADAVLCNTESQRDLVWDIRENFEAILPAYLYDVSLPIAEMDAYAAGLNQSLKARFPQGECHIMGHIADGNLHLFISTGEDADRHDECDELVYQPLRSIGGSVSAEHGIGSEKMRWLSVSKTPEELAMMNRLKQSLDPNAILNRGRVLSG